MCYGTCGERYRYLLVGVRAIGNTLLIQIGGLGVVTVAASFALISGRKISLMQRSTMQEAIAAPKVGGIVKLTGFVLKATLILRL